MAKVELASVMSTVEPTAGTVKLTIVVEKAFSPLFPAGPGTGVSCGVSQGLGWQQLAGGDVADILTNLIRRLITLVNREISQLFHNLVPQPET